MFWVSLVLMALVFLVISFRLEKMTNQLEQRQEALKQIRDDAHTQKGIILADLKGADPSSFEYFRLWKQYHEIDYEQSRAEVEYVLTYGEKDDPWNYEANKRAAFQHQYSASQWLHHPSPRKNSPREGMI